eukprot:1160545-Pelagomonas_calceolata.AAC.25
MQGQPKHRRNSTSRTDTGALRVWAKQTRAPELQHISPPILLHKHLRNVIMMIIEECGCGHLRAP